MGPLGLKEGVIAPRRSVGSFALLFTSAASVGAILIAFMLLAMRRASSSVSTLAMWASFGIDVGTQEQRASFTP